MSRKLVNVLTFLSIVIGEIYLLYISILTIHDIKKYNISAIQMAIIIFIFFFLQ